MISKVLLLSVNQVKKERERRKEKGKKEEKDNRFEKSMQLQNETKEITKRSVCVCVSEPTCANACIHIRVAVRRILF